MAERFGGVTLSEIEEFSQTTSLPDAAGASTLTRFVKNVATIVASRAAQGEGGGISVFLLSAAVDEDVQGHEHEDVPLLATGNEPILSRAWLSNARLGTAYALAALDCSDAGRLRHSIRALGLGCLPALFIDWRGAAPIGHLFAGGVDAPDDADRVELGLPEIQSDDLKACLDHFYGKTLRTPSLVSAGHGQRVWRRASRGVPEDRPEERIQGRLLDHLRARFTQHHVRAEVETEEGRCDLVIRAHLVSPSGQRQVRVEWLLELKALTDRTCNDESVPDRTVREAVTKGVTQAHSYRDAEHAEKAALCCYDMRRTDETDSACFAHVAQEASRRRVLLWRWFMHRSAEAGRQAALQPAPGGAGP